ncbi:hypothetical protein Bca52824_031746 [Brassica carinata]|uniref:Uncharacterized protein n=1 Tax=Brassica carinata TaxID=52824 RepID=A0A8X7SAM3_BRACI|nr:hypothetical protein Bca52824_031746 [Brassica carinata]
MSVVNLVEDWSDTDEEPPKETVTGGSRVGRNSQGRHQSNNIKPNYQQGNGPGNNNSKEKPNNAPNSTGGRNSEGHNRLKPPFRRLTKAEVAERKAKGLCYRCDEKYHRNHRCPFPELMVLMIQEDGTEVDISERVDEVEESEETEGVEVGEHIWRKYSHKILPKAFES